MLSTAVVATTLADADHYGPGPWWPIFPILWFAFIAFAIFMLARFGRRRWHDGSRSGESRLGERYAAGEIDEREYRERLGVLKENRS